MDYIHDNDQYLFQNHSSQSINYYYKHAIFDLQINEIQTQEYNY